MLTARQRTNVRDYFIRLAEHYERNGFIVAAVLIYRRFDRKRLKRIYRLLAKEAHMNGLYGLAAEAYEACGQKSRARKIRRYFGLGNNGHPVPLFYREDNSSDTPVTRLLFATTRFEREGDFERAKNYWLKAARYCEMVGELRFSAVYYFKCGELRNAKRLWRKVVKAESLII